jgi:DNA-binding CsgD family transcriptional regulator
MVKSGGNLLSKEDSFVLLDLIYSSLSCVTEEQLIVLINQLKCLFPHEFAICILLQRTTALIDVSHSINVSYPPDWCSHYVSEDFDKMDPIVRESAAHGNGIQYWADTYKKYDAEAFASCARDFGLREGYSHGVRTPSGDKRSFFSFAGSSVDRQPRTELILRHVVPHLDQAFKRIVGGGKEKSNRLKAGLSPREREILNWAKVGKSSWEISMILSISISTVLFHVKNIMEKLEVVNRTQAVAVALQSGLIDIE